MEEIREAELNKKSNHPTGSMASRSIQLHMLCGDQEKLVEDAIEEASISQNIICHTLMKSTKDIGVMCRHSTTEPENHLVMVHRVPYGIVDSSPVKPPIPPRYIPTTSAAESPAKGMQKSRMWLSGNQLYSI